MKAGQTKRVESPDMLRWAFITMVEDRYDGKPLFIVNTYSLINESQIKGTSGNQFHTEEEAMQFAEDFINN